jgi:hypothetical protein
VITTPPRHSASVSGVIPDDHGRVLLTGIYKNMPRGIVALVFRCKITGGQLTSNDEVTTFHWADETDIGRLTSEAYAVRLLDALDEDAAPAIRQHDGIELIN